MSLMMDVNASGGTAPSSRRFGWFVLATRFTGQQFAASVEPHFYIADAIAYTARGEARLGRNITDGFQAVLCPL
jgi:hypothetical protein